MKSFMRSISILFSATFLVLVPGPAFASLGAANDNKLLETHIYDNDTEKKKCEEDLASFQVKSCSPSDEYIAAKKKEKEKEDARKQAGGSPGGEGGGGTNQGDKQNGSPANDQQAKNNHSDKPSGNSGQCADTSADPNGKAAKNSPVQGDKGEADKPGKGKQQACAQIQGSFDQRARQASQQGQSAGLKTNFQGLEKDLQEYQKNREACLSNQADASTQCLEGLSPDTAGAANGVNSVLGQVGQNASDTCGKFSKAMDLAKAGLSAFSANCGAAQGSCSSSCQKASDGLKALVKKAQAEASGGAKCMDPANVQCQSLLMQYQQALQEGIGAAQEEMKADDAESVAGKQKICDKKYKGNINGALQGLMGMLAGMMQGNKCEEETDGTGEDKKGNIADRCMLAENATLPECICKVSPLTVGCGGSSAKLSEASSSQYAGGLDAKNTGDGEGPSTTLDNLNEKMQHAKLPDGGEGAGAPMGGGSAGLGSGGTGSGPGAQNAEGGGSGLNTNILAGTGGGGGGGGGWGAARGENYRNYLPGGAKDPTRGVAGQQAWTKEVTGQGGKSNWEKVKDRYRDNKSSLLNN